MKIASAAARFHGFGVARQGPWITWVNRLWALLRTSPLHAVEHLLRLGRELLEAGRSCLFDYGHRLTLYIFHYDEANLLSLIDTPSCPSAFVDEAKV